MTVTVATAESRVDAVSSISLIGLSSFINSVISRLSSSAIMVGPIPVIVGCSLGSSLSTLTGITSGSEVWPISSRKVIEILPLPIRSGDIVNLPPPSDVTDTIPEPGVSTSNSTVSGLSS